MKFAAAVFVSSLAAIPGAVAWGALGHETVGYVASNFVSSATKTYCQDLLGTTTTDYLAAVATWADSYRYTTAGQWSAPLHFIDAQDNPPSSCNVNFDRDCGENGCVVSAIQNYTARIQDSSLSQADRAVALKFIVHFVGDIHQPLHDEALDVGGNTIDVTFNGQSTNLHACWDTAIPQQYAGSATLTNAQSFASKLTTQIKSGSYKSMTGTWLQGADLSDPQGTAMIWASSANSYVCSTVLKGGVSAVEGHELSGSYYNSALPVVEEQLAAAGYRLAAWLNLIVTGSTGLS